MPEQEYLDSRLLALRPKTRVNLKIDEFEDEVRQAYQVGFVDGQAGIPQPDPDPNPIPDPDPTPPPPDPDPIPPAPGDFPGQAIWQQRMIDSGLIMRDISNVDLSGNWVQERSVLYYDGGYAIYQIGDYLQNTAWKPFAESIVLAYRQKVLDGLHANGDNDLAGRWVFPDGLLYHYLETNDPETLTALEVGLGTSASVNWNGGTPSNPPGAPESWEDYTRSKAYALEACVAIKEATNIAHPKEQDRLNDCIEMANAYIAGNAAYIKPFMIGLLATALIKYTEGESDVGVDATISALVAWIREHPEVWLPQFNSYKYLNHDTADENGPWIHDPQYDLNALISYPIQWVATKVNDPALQVQADAVLESGITNAWFGDATAPITGIQYGGKQFAQCYKLSFKQLALRF